MSEAPSENPETETVPARQATIAAEHSVRNMKREVEADRLRLDPATGDEILKTLTEQREQVDGWLKRAVDLTRSAPLGRNPVADAMSTKFANRAKSEEDSFIAVLERYRTVLDDAHDAVDDAIRRYHNVDEAAADMFRRVAKQVDD